MNKNQKIALGIGLAAFAVSLFFVPVWNKVADTLLIYRTPFWDVYWSYQGVHVEGLLLDWAIIGILTGGAMLLLKRPKE